MIMQSKVLMVVTYLYFAASILYVAAWIFKKELAGKIATWLTIIGLAGNLTGMLMRWVESYRMGIGHAPLSNMYESLVFFAFTIVALYLYMEFRYKYRTIGAVVVPVAFLTMAYASLPGISGRIQPLLPALKSNWLIGHVFTCFLGYAAFAMAFCISILYLIKIKEKIDKENSIISRLPPVEILDELNHRLIMFGFLFLTIGIITGSVWANSAWGKYWSWDPKETWSLITWLIYALLLHARLMRGWNGQRIAYISIVGFIAVLFTYFGVNTLLPGLHSYA
ncbi:c-type cytochrome biogenesis protein CcsB [Desulfobacterales bacterium HSG16]|nr:c-type cytochrome biogenesis protein CcsB [Desulfobacterales bacterium HSG16]